MVHRVCENAGKGYSSMYQDVKRAAFPRKLTPLRAHISTGKADYFIFSGWFCRAIRFFSFKLQFFQWFKRI